MLLTPPTLILHVTAYQDHTNRSIPCNPRALLALAIINCISFVPQEGLRDTSWLVLDKSPTLRDEGVTERYLRERAGIDLGR